MILETRIELVTTAPTVRMDVFLNFTIRDATGGTRTERILTAIHVPLINPSYNHIQQRIGEGVYYYVGEMGAPNSHVPDRKSGIRAIITFRHELADLTMAWSEADWEKVICAAFMSMQYEEDGKTRVRLEVETTAVDVGALVAAIPTQ